MNKIRTILILISTLAVCALVYILLFNPFVPQLKNEVIKKDINSNSIEKVTVINNSAIILSSPIDNQEITSPITLKGKAKVFENTFNYVIADSTGKTLGEGVGTTNGTDINSYGDFSINATFEKPTSRTGTIELFEYSTKDGSIMNHIKVNVVFNTQKL